MAYLCPGFSVFQDFTELYPTLPCLHWHKVEKFTRGSSMRVLSFIFGRAGMTPRPGMPESYPKPTPHAC